VVVWIVAIAEPEATKELKAEAEVVVWIVAIAEPEATKELKAGSRIKKM